MKKPVRSIHLLPIYDEYIVAYRDREAVGHGPGTISKNGRSITFQHALVIDGKVAGTWRTPPSGRDGSIDVTPVRRLTRAERDEVEAAADRYRNFRRA